MGISDEHFFKARKGHDMEVRFIAQPDEQVGNIIISYLESIPSPTRVIFVSAFWGIQTVLRIREQIYKLKEIGTDIQLVVGVDMGGTSKEVLEEMAKWPANIYIYKNRKPRVTFHPKIFLFEYQDKSIIIVGSNNMTEGGFFTNYEACSLSKYNLPEDKSFYDQAISQLSRFLAPSDKITRILDKQYLTQLIQYGGIPTEGQASARRQEAARGYRHLGDASVYGTETTPPIPPLSSHLLESLTLALQQKRRQNRNNTTVEAKNAITIPKTGDNLLVTPGAFYMTLPTLQGPKIPGEARIPLDAIELAYDFWGWPEMYAKTVSPRSGKERIYYNWKPKWRIRDLETNGFDTVQEVRMYKYENSSDFRFYAKPLVNAGANLGDVVKIERVALPTYEFDCVLAKNGSRFYTEWLNNCTITVHNSTRRFGYA